MSADQINQNVPSRLIFMESVNRFSKLLVVDSTIKTAKSIYEKVKDYNLITQWTLSTAENTMNMTVQVGRPIATPIIQYLEGPFKKVDFVLCTGLDYVENKVPAVKLPAGEIYNSTYSYRAKSATELAVKRTRGIVEPLVQPALDKTYDIKENVMNKVDKLLWINYCVHCTMNTIMLDKHCNAKNVKKSAEKQKNNGKAIKAINKMNRDDDDDDDDNDDVDDDDDDHDDDEEIYVN
ncbi:unnamed protein product [Psylliodes chrysocephalus]|uniref:Uncharacterized protein n=1 Tax=Psylliodes chrysocephalus TaxID=3402493 RepID=A0A9P0D3H0_9CUCU|nr:unnamed protein product [Psylliodes chrysocephala]